MAAKVILTIFAAFFLSQALNAATVQSTGASALNITELIEEIISRVQTIINDVDTEVEEAIINVENNITKALETLGEEWEYAVESVVETLTATAAEIKYCEDKQTPFSTVLAELKNDTEKCIETRIDDIKKAASEVLVSGIEIIEKGSEAAFDFVKCIAKIDIFKVTLCLIEEMPIEVGELAGLYTKLVTREAYVVEKITELAPLATLCITECTANRTVEAEKIINSTITCIEDTL